MTCTWPISSARPETHRRALAYYNLVNSPATMINADDLENWTKAQWGLQSNGGDWVSFHRYFGDDREDEVAVGVRQVVPLLTAVPQPHAEPAAERRGVLRDRGAERVERHELVDDGRRQPLLRQRHHVHHLGGRP